MMIGYARVSTMDQSLDNQIQTLNEAGCGKIFHDKVSGKKSNRAGLQEALSHLREGDTLVVTKLDRLGRDLRDLVNLLYEFERKGIKFKSIHDTIDTSSAAGKLHVQMIAAMAEFEQGLTSERVREGLSKARARGKVGGRKFKVPDEDKELFVDLYLNRNVSLSYIRKKFGISMTCIYTTAKRFGLDDRLARDVLIAQRADTIKTTSAEKTSQE